MIERGNMYKCDNCGGDLVFDPYTQSLMCNHCGSHFPLSPERDKDLEMAEDGTYETQVFTCPNCGGQLMGLTESIVDFCPYCGSEVQMPTEKIKKDLPELIVPFRIGREQCKDIYKKGAKKFIFAPRELKSDAFIDRVQGVYVPYWSYVCKFEGQINANVVYSTTSGDYIDNDYVNLGKQVDGFTIVSKDASRELDDELSIGAGGFNDDSIMYFKPQYLAGFYADLPDVNADYYEQQATTEAMDVVMDKVLDKHQPNTTIIGVDEKNLHQNVEAKRSAMPLYFLTWRDKDKVSYSLINGQSGNLSAKLPVDLKKYFLISLLMAVPLFCLFFFANITFWPSTTAVCSGIMLLIAMALAQSAGKHAFVKEKIFFGCELDKKERKFLENPNNYKTVVNVCLTIFICMIFLFPITIGAIQLIAAFSDWDFVIRIVVIALSVLNIYRLFKYASDAHQYALGYPNGWFKKLSGILKFCAISGTIGIILSEIVTFVDLIVDEYYYAIIIYTMAVSFIILIDLIREYNISVTRPLKYFDRRKGLKDNA